MELPNRIPPLENALSLLSWLQIKFVKLGNHINAEKIGNFISQIEDLMDKIDEMELLHRGEELKNLLDCLNEITKDEIRIDDVQIESLQSILSKLTKGPFYRRRTLIEEAEIKRRVNELAEILRKELDPYNTIVLGVLRGSIFFMVDLLRALDMPLRFDFVDAKSYGDRMDSSKDVKLNRLEKLDLKNKIVLIVEDIVDTGHTMKALTEFVRSQGPEKIITCVLIDKHERREVEVTIDHYGFQVQEGFLVGYGLDYADRYRCLPAIYILEPISE